MNLLITGAWQGAEAHISELEAMGHSTVFLRMEKDPLPCDAAWVEGAVCNGLFLHHPMEGFPNLRFVQLTSAGFDRVDMRYAAEHGIKVHNARGVYSIPMAEFALSGVLQLYKQARFFEENRASRRWEKHRGLLELYGRRAVIVGCGSVGTECAKRFGAMGCGVTGVDIAPRLDEAFDVMLPLERLDEALTGAEVLVLTVPLTEATEKLIDGRRLGLLPRNAVVVNISRGRVPDETALCEMLKDGRIAGAVLDVFETEPLPASSPLWELDNVILTPHNSFVGEGNGERLWRVIVRNIKAL